MKIGSGGKCIERAINSMDYGCSHTLVSVFLFPLTVYLSVVIKRSVIFHYDDTTKIGSFLYSCMYDKIISHYKRPRGIFDKKKLQRKTNHPHNILNVLNKAIKALKRFNGMERHCLST